MKTAIELAAEMSRKLAAPYDHVFILSMTPEGRVKEKVKEIFKRHDVWYYMPVQTGYGTHGIPDFLACVAGRLLGVECKGTDDGRPTPLQTLCMDRIVRSKGCTYLATPGTIAGLENLVLCILNDAK